MKRLYFFCILACLVLFNSCKDYDDSEIQNKIGDFKQRIEVLRTKVNKLNEDISKLGYLTEGNVITSVSQNTDGKYVITYKDSNNEEKAIIIATKDDVIEVPVLGVRQDETDRLYYWTTTMDGETSWLTNDNEEKIPVCGYTPKLSIDDEGYWTVNGTRLTDKAGKPIVATTEATAIFKNLSKTDDGTLEVTLGNGETFTLEIFNSLNLKLKSDAVTTVSDTSRPITIEYEVAGATAENAIIAIAQTTNVQATLNKETRVITVTFGNYFSEGHLIITAYDTKHLVLRPLLFKKN